VNDYRLGFCVFDDYNNTPYTINVGAYLATGIVTNYSSPGSNLWISSAGGYDGVKAPAMVTTDRKGCTLGYSNSELSGTSGTIGAGFQKGRNGNGGCNYTVQFNGTSSAAPTASGAIALLLNAYPKLTWRDVKYILAKTAKEAALDFDSSENYLYSINKTVYLNHKSPTGYKWDEGWVTNAAGFRFSNYYGFGKIDVDKAITFASAYTSLFKSPLLESSQSVTGLNEAVPDFSSTGATFRLFRMLYIQTVASLPWN
jgi:subtilisin family serine protease